MQRKNFNPTDWLKGENKVVEKKTSKNGNTHDLENQVETLIKVIEDQGLDITSVYADWRNIGFAFADAFGEAGRALFHRISQFWVDYTPKECDRHFDNYLKSKGTGITIRTFFYLAKQAGIEISPKKSQTMNPKRAKREEPLSPLSDSLAKPLDVPDDGDPKAIYFTLEDLSIKPDDAISKELESRADEILRISEHKYWNEFEEPIPCIEIEINGIRTPIGTPGNFSATKGPPKSRKTFFVSTMMAASLKNGCIQNVIYCNLPEDKRKVVLFDTEQGEAHVNKVVRRAFTLAGICKEELESYSEIFHVHLLRPYDASDRVLAIERYLEKTIGVGLVIIDGIRDLAYDINNIEQSVAAVQNLMRWTHEKQLHLITVIHVNKNDKNATGHLGGELTKKAESVIEVARVKTQKNTSTVEATECRGIEFDKFAFTIDENGLPQVIILSEEKDQLKQIRSLFPADIPYEFHIEALNKIFAKESKIIASKFLHAVIAAFGQIF